MDDPQTIEFLGRKVLFGVQSKFAEKRIRFFHEKEPDTIAVISELAEGDVFWDIGASTGIYSLPAAMTGALVYAFEPMAGNFFAMTENFQLNGSPTNLYPLNIAVSDVPGATFLNVKDPTPGCGMSTVVGDWGYRGIASDTRYRQGVIAADAELLLKLGIRRPTHVKIDVDGIEPRVIRALEPVWPDVSVAVIETDHKDERHREAMAYMESLGFGFSEEQVARATRRSGGSEGVGNVVWRRGSDG